MDQSESALGAALSTPQSVIAWSSEFVTLTEVGPNLGARTFGTRYYDSSLGRWTATDSVPGSILNPGTLNRYNYASCNPINATDPTGYFNPWNWHCWARLALFVHTVWLLATMAYFFTIVSIVMISGPSQVPIAIALLLIAYYWGVAGFTAYWLVKEAINDARNVIRC